MHRTLAALLVLLPAVARAGWTPPPFAEPSPAPAVEPEPPPADLLPDDTRGVRTVPFGLRGAVGIGGGTAGLALGGSASADYWLGSMLGVGARLGGASATFLFFSESSLWFAEPMVLLKAGSERTYLRLGFGVGAGRASYRDTFLYFVDETPPVEHVRTTAVVSLDAAVLWHPGGVELGPVVSLDDADGDIYVLVGFTIGGAVQGDVARPD